jgi:uncharacterized protein YbjT (DUF2867 family)
MKIVVIGGTGLIGKRTVRLLTERGHDVIAASPSRGIDAVTGQGLATAMVGANVVIDVANAPVWEDQAVLEFFQKSGHHLMATETDAGVQHHVALSVVGTDRLQASGYFRAKLAQEELIKASSIPYTIVRATQFFEFAGSIAQSETHGDMVRLPSAMMQPVAADDVAELIAEVAEQPPRNGMIELAGPEPIRMNELIQRYLAATGDVRRVVVDAGARYYGLAVTDQSLTPGDAPRLGRIRFDDWLAHQSGGVH